MDDIDKVNYLEIRKRFLAEIQEKILKFFSSKRFLLISGLSAIYIIIIISFFIFNVDTYQKLLEAEIIANNLPHFSIQALVLLAVLLVFVIFPSVLLVLLNISAIRKKSNQIIKTLKLNVVYYQIYRSILYFLMFIFTIFLLYSVFFGLRMRNSTSTEYIGFYFVFYLISIVLYMVIYFFISLAKSIVEVSKGMIYNLEGFTDTFVAKDSLKISLYINIFVNSIFAMAFFVSYFTIDRDSLYYYDNLTLWLGIIIVNVIILSFALIRHLDKHTFYVDIDKIKKYL